MDRYFPRIAPLLAASLLFLTGCFDSSESESDVEAAEDAVYREEKASREAIRERVSDLKAEKKELEDMLEDIGKSLKKADEIRAEEVKLSSEVEVVRAYVSSLGSLEQSVDGALGVWRVATRGSFKGVKIPEIVTVAGTQYSDVTLLEVTDTEVKISHIGGEAAIPVLDLPIGLRRNVIHEATVLTEAGI